MPRIAPVAFRHGGKVYDFDAGDLDLAAGDQVVVDTTHGHDLGFLVAAPREVPADEAPRDLRPVLRRATDEDLAVVAAHRETEARARAECRRLAADLGLDLKVVEARESFSGGKLTVSVYAEERVDTRRLAQRLADALGRRVEVRMVSARDQSRVVGGYGPCGRSLCCATFAGDQEPVSIRMAKDQDLPLNPGKISGLCGRLLCCLKYEHEVYVEFRRRAPKKGSLVRTPLGEGRVVDLVATSESVVVDLGDGRSARVRVDEVEPVNGKEQQ